MESRAVWVAYVVLLGCFLSGCSGRAADKSMESPARVGLEGIRCVQVVVDSPEPRELYPGREIENVSSESLHGTAVEGLRARLPGIVIGGPLAQWTVKIELRYQYENLPVMAAKVPDVWIQGRSQLIRPVNIDGRSAIAVAYESRPWFGSPHPLSHERQYAGGLADALNRVLDEFAADWREANRILAPR